MTMEEVSLMPAGLEMNRLIEIHAFGFSPSAMQPGYVKIGARAGMPRAFSTDKSTAIALLDCFEDFLAEKQIDDYPKYTVWIEYGGEGRMFVAAGKTLGEAVGRTVILVALEHPGILKNVRGSKIQ